MAEIPEKAINPVSLEEIAAETGLFNAQRRIPEFLVMGMLPQVLAAENRAEKLRVLLDRAVTGGILAVAGLRNPQAFLRLLHVLAGSVGRDVTMESLGRAAGVSRHTAESYLALLEEAGLVTVCRPWADSLPTEVRGTRKIWFRDLGIRNAVLNDFTHAGARKDLAGLWQNFFFMERVKWNAAHGTGRELHFWRLMRPSTAHIDFIETGPGGMRLFACREDGARMPKLPALFEKAYGPGRLEIVDRRSVVRFITGNGGMTET
ncbi:DUF4143 domain-containing protein [Sutterella sp.]|uniref:DUF4143 domain-containing protein n=1 Tax=Sutterella sp. TaxID=1981025 RepID=UPI0026E05FC6|nr:DUF4143 domain-containing protein [Sutterella sp.]MDO5530851.1 DUF4143 domain-containing protein [Sutterella sp.]